MWSFTCWCLTLTAVRGFSWCCRWLIICVSMSLHISAGGGHIQSWAIAQWWDSKESSCDVTDICCLCFYPMSDHQSHTTYLLHCPCHPYRVFPWLRDTRPLSTLIGRCSAIHWPPECSVRCCCRDRDTPLSGGKHTVREVRGEGGGGCRPSGSNWASTNIKGMCWWWYWIGRWALTMCFIFSLQKCIITWASETALRPSRDQ